MDDNTEIPDELRDEIEKEITTAYVAGLVDGDANIVISVSKDSEYKLNYTIIHGIRIRRKQPFAIQILDDWATKNNIFASIRKYEDRYEFQLGKIEDMGRFCEILVPYVQDKFEVFNFILDEYIPLIEEGKHRESKETFIEVVEHIDEIRERDTGMGASKYTADYFKEEWNM